MYMRKLVFEQLEKRDLLCAASDVLNIINAINLQSEYNKNLDSNKDGIISPIDALILINKINFDDNIKLKTPSIIASKENNGKDDLINIGFVNNVGCINNSFVQVLIVGKSDNIIIKIGEKEYKPISSNYIRGISSWNFDISFYPGQRIYVYGNAEVGSEISLMFGGR